MGWPDLKFAFLFHSQGNLVWRAISIVRLKRRNNLRQSLDILHILVVPAQEELLEYQHAR